MKCFYHPDRDAVGQCVECSRGLCSECAGKWEPPLCDNCAGNAASSAKASAISHLVILVLFALAGILYAYWAMWISPAATKNIFQLIISGILTAYFVAAIPAGWWKLNKITSGAFLFLPVFGWLIYFVLKAILSMFVGLVVLPIECVHSIRIIKNR